MTAASDYVRAGLALVSIPAGTKGPRTTGWNLRENCITSEAQAARLNGENIGLAHAYCMPTPTGALDIDQFEAAASWLDAHGIDLASLLMAPSAVQIRSGRPGRAKALYRLPEALPSIVIKGEDGETALEFRCASAGGLTVQDVLPPSIHPDTGKCYEWLGDWRVLPGIPGALLTLWNSLTTKHGGRRDAIHIVGRSDEAAASGRAKLHPELLRGARDCPREAGRGVDRSALVWKVLTHMVGRGVSDTEIVSVLTDPALGVSAKALEKPNPAAWLCGQIAKARASMPPADAPTDKESRPPGFSDDAIADRFVSCHGENLRYVAQWGTWLEWDGRRWVTDRTVHIFDMVRTICRLTAQGAAKDSLARAVASATAVAAAERLARADRRVAALPEEFDANDYLLNTPSGIVDLRTGQTRPARREDRLTKITGVAPDTTMACPTFGRFLEAITRGDEELAEYLRRVVGYCACGDTREHAFFFAHGGGGNGKSTFVDIIQFVFGDYAKTIPAETLLEARGGRHPTEIANLMGVRLALSSELEEGQWWAEARVKSLTGDEQLSARFMRQDFFSFRKTHKHLIAGNHRPALRTVDAAMRRRMHLLPFEAQFIGTARDSHMLEKLKAEAPAILAWAIHKAALSGKPTGCGRRSAPSWRQPTTSKAWTR